MSHCPLNWKSMLPMKNRKPKTPMKNRKPKTPMKNRKPKTPMKNTDELDYHASYVADILFQKGHVELAVPARRRDQIFRVCEKLHPTAKMVTGLRLDGILAIVFLPRAAGVITRRLQEERIAFEDALENTTKALRKL